MVNLFLDTNFNVTIGAEFTAEERLFGFCCEGHYVNIYTQYLYTQYLYTIFIYAQYFYFNTIFIQPIYSFISKLYREPFQETYSNALPAEPQS